MSSWAQTAKGLADDGEHDVLLVDFYAHGRSPGIYPFHRLNVDTLVQQVLNFEIKWHKHALRLYSHTLVESHQSYRHRKFSGTDAPRLLSHTSMQPII